MTLLKIESIEVTYGHQVVFRGFSHDFAEGCYAITGQNGIGKSTLLTVIAGSYAPCKGRIMMNGIDLYRNPVLAKSHLFYVPDSAIFYPFVTDRAFLSFVLGIYNKAALLKSNDTFDLIASLGLDSHLDTRFSDASLGTRVKFYLLAALVIRPAILIMDEPFNGLDRASTTYVIGFLLQHLSQCVVLFSTHHDTVVKTLGAQRLILDNLPNFAFKTGK